MNTIHLPGCRPLPLAAYLKGLGVFRLVSEQRDPEARCFWQNEQFVLQTSLTKEQLEGFFLNEYKPSPIMAPWNGGSGFYPKDNERALKKIESSQAKRFSAYQTCLAEIRSHLRLINLNAKPEKKKDKAYLLEQLRNIMPEEALEWLDAVFLLSESGPKYPPLLGTGGNDGRFEFTNNFMQRLMEVFSSKTGQPTNQAASWLNAALFDEPIAGMEKVPIGQFDPNSAGGANAATGFDAPSRVNPWDFVLMLEGTLLFAVASAKRLESHSRGQLAYPFCVRQAGVGYASETLADEQSARAEIWMPLWKRPAGLDELRAVLNEGRAQVSGKPARSGVDFARAVTSLGVDRGLSEFQRFGFQVRNGLAYFATPLDRLPVRQSRHVRLLDEIDPWLDKFRSKAASTNPEPPAGIASTLRRLENSILRLCQADTEDPARAQDVLCALGYCQRRLSRSVRWTRDSAFLKPLQNLSEKWLDFADTGSVEFRLAAALASSTLDGGKRMWHFRHFLEPVEFKGSMEKHWIEWREKDLRDTVWSEGDLTATLNVIMGRQLLLAQKAGAKFYKVGVKRPAPLSDVIAFIEGNVNESLLAELLWSLSLLDWPNIEKPRRNELKEDRTPTALYSLLKLCFPGSEVKDVKVPLIPAIHHNASRGNALQGTLLASRRLHASGLAPAITSLSAKSELSKRVAASLVFPISPWSRQHIEGQILAINDEQAVESISP